MNLLSSFGPAAAAAAVTVSTTPVLSDSPSTCTSLSSAASHHINSSSGTNGYTNLTGHPAGHSLPPTSHPFNSSQFHPHSIAGHNGYGSSGQSHLSNYLGGSGNNLTATSGHTPLAEYGIMNNLSIPMYATKRRRRNSKWWVWIAFSSRFFYSQSSLCDLLVLVLCVLCPPHSPWSQWGDTHWDYARVRVFPFLTCPCACVS